MLKYHLITLGCQMNLSDDERIRTVIEAMGYEYTEDEKEAHLLGIIACSVRQKAIDKVYNRIHIWNRWKENKHLISFVTGCILLADYRQFLKLFDFVFQTRDIEKLPEMIAQYGVSSPVRGFGKQKITDEESKALFQSGLKVENMNNYWEIEPMYNSGFEAFVPIQNGCDKFCTYCAVPYTRGREVSRKSEDIINEVKDLVKKGYKSITLLGQNVNSYGLDKGTNEISFAELLDKIGQFGNESGKRFWLYFTSPHPRDMTKNVIDTIAKYDCLAKQIHLPIQSGDDQMLKKMNRQHTLEDYRQIVHYIWEKLPESTLFTDIIVGFTGETDEQLEHSRKAMEEFKYNMAYIAKYSPRPGAVSESWEDNIDKQTKGKRYDILTDELLKHSFEKNKQLLGKEMLMLVKGKSKKGNYLIGYTEGRIVARFAGEDESLIGSFVKIKVTSVAALSIEGEVVQ